MPILPSNSPAAVTIDGAYVYTLTPASPTAPPTSAFGAIVGFATDGQPNTLIPFDRNSLGPNLGIETTDAHDIVTQARLYLNRAPQGFAVRVVAGTEVAAQILLKDVLTGTLDTLTAKWVGSGPNGSYAYLTFNALASTGSPAYDLTIQKQSTDGSVKANAEVWHNLPAFATAGVGYDPATLRTNIAAAVNSGTQERGPSQYWTATAGTGTGAVVVATNYLVTVLGTDGTVTDALCVGIDGNAGSRTGMYVLRGAGTLGINAFILSGVTTRADDATVGAFAQSEVGISMGGTGFASGTTPAAAQLAITSYPVGLFRYLGFVGVNSSIASTNGYRRVSPAGAELATIVTTPPWVSLGDQPRLTGYPGILDSEMDPTSPNSLQIGPGDQYIAQQIGLLYFTTQTPQGGGVFANPHGQSAAASNITLNTIQAQRTAVYLAQDALQILGQFAHLNQGASVDDAFRREVVNTMNAHYADLARASAIVGGSAIDQLAGTTSQPTAGDNSPTTIAQGFNFLQLSVATFTGVRWIIATLVEGPTVTVGLVAA